MRLGIPLLSKGTWLFPIDKDMRRDKGILKIFDERREEAPTSRTPTVALNSVIIHTACRSRSEIERGDTLLHCPTFNLGYSI